MTLKRLKSNLKKKRRKEYFKCSYANQNDSSHDSSKMIEIAFYLLKRFYVSVSLFVCVKKRASFYVRTREMRQTATIFFQSHLDARHVQSSGKRNNFFFLSGRWNDFDKKCSSFCLSSSFSKQLGRCLRASTTTTDRNGPLNVISLINIPFFSRHITVY